MKYKHPDAKHTKAETCIPNEFMIKPHISIDAKMIACYMESHPKKYLINIHDIAKEMGMSVNKVTKAWVDLVKIGLIEKNTKGHPIYTGLWEPDLRP